MSNCENSCSDLRGDLCKDCPLGKPGMVSKIVIALENSGCIFCRFTVNLTFWLPNKYV